MRTLIRFLLAAALLAASPAGATDFKTWVPGLATKTTAPGATDYYPIVPNGGATEKVPGTSLLWSANNLSDLGSAASARANLGLAATNRVTSGTTNTLSAISAQFTTELWVSGAAGAKTDTVPECTSSLNGDYLAEVDGEGNAAADPITVTAASGTIGPAGTPAPGASYSIFANGGVALFQCDGAATHWALVSATASAGRVNYQTGTSYTVAATDNGGVVDLGNAASIAVTLPQAGTTGFPEGGFSTLLRASGAGAVTVTPATSTLNGAASATIASGNALLVFADGAGNYEGVPIQGALPATVTAGSCTSCNITFTAQGIATAYANGSGGSGGLGVTYQANSWYWPYLHGALVSGGSQTTGYVQCTAGVLLGSATIEGLAAYAGGAAGNIQLALYHVGTWGLPGTLIASTPSIAVTTTSAAVSGSFGAAQSLTAGEYYLCAEVDTTGITTGDLELNSNSGMPVLLGSSSASGILILSASADTGYYGVETFGTWPAFTSGTSWTATANPIAVIVQVKTSP